MPKSPFRLVDEENIRRSVWPFLKAEKENVRVHKAAQQKARRSALKKARRKLEDTNG